jgi:hypothetical protein
VRRFVSYAVLALSLFITWQSYENSRQRPETEAFAKQIACDVDSSCLLQTDHANVTRTDPIRRRYEYGTTVGPVLVTCKRSLLWLGDWSCAAERGSLAH